MMSEKTSATHAASHGECRAVFARLTSCPGTSSIRRRRSILGDDIGLELDASGSALDEATQLSVFCQNALPGAVDGSRRFRVS